MPDRSPQMFSSPYRMLASAAFLGLSFFVQLSQAQGAIHVNPAPDGEPLSTQFKVVAGQTSIPVYVARVMGISPEERKHLGTPVEKETTTTSFASFDLPGEAKISVTCQQPVESVKLLPVSSGVHPAFSGNVVTFTVTKPEQLTLEVNGNWVNSLHLFINPVETNLPDPNDPNVIYFGPGIHNVEGITVPSGKTVYLAEGAIIYGHLNGQSPKTPVIYLQGSDIVLRGRGIIDGSLCPWHTRSVLGVNGTSIRVEGVILRDSSGFTLPVRKSDNVKISNVKVFGWRGNSDGMDLCNSRQVEVSDCFLRTFDDLVVLKTDKNEGELRDVTVKRCVLWNEFAHALSLGAELREPLTNVIFSDCDVIHDKGREWVLRVYHCDSAPVKNVVFENIRIEEARRLLSVWIGKAIWSKEAERGQVDGVSFKDIVAVKPELPGPIADLVGFDAGHEIAHVQFQDVVVGGQPLQKSDVQQNAFVHDVVVVP